MIDASSFFGIPWVWSGVSVLNAVSAVVLALFSLGVGWLAGFRGAGRWYAVFGVSFGWTTAMLTLYGTFLLAYGPLGTLVFASGDVTRGSAVMFAVLNILAGVGACVWVYAIVRLLALYGVLAPHKSIILWSGGLGAMLFALPGNLLFADGAGLLNWIALPFRLAARMLPVGVLSVAPLLLAIAYVRRPVPGQAILAAALCAYPIVIGVSLAAALLDDGVLIWLGLSGPVGLLATAGGWWWAREKTGNKHASRVAWLAVVAFSLAVLLAAYRPTWTLANAARFFDILLVGYAILRYQYLGLDVRVRWGISKSTVAAVFVAVFFIVSEAAQAFFGERLQSEYLGIAAAGLLVLGIAPLQRFADRFAERAVVPVGATPSEQYQAALAVAMADGHISPAQEVVLAELADRLGLRVGETLALRNEIQA